MSRGEREVFLAQPIHGCVSWRWGGWGGMVGIYRSHVCCLQAVIKGWWLSYASHGILPDAGRTCELRSAAANCGYASGIMPAM